MYSLLQTVLAFVVTLGVLIFVHEYGHFWVARRCGVKVLRFSIGFGQPLVTWHDRHDTEFVIAAIPLGGYVKMLGEPGADIPVQEQSQSFAHKSVFQRFAIVSAGPLVNLVFAVFLYWLLFLSGVTSVAPIVGNVLPNTLAEQAGFQKMDEIVAVDDRATETWDDVMLELVARLGDSGDVSFMVRPEGQTAIEERRLTLDRWMDGQEKENPLRLLGLEPFYPTIPPVIGEVEAGMAADRQGLKPGDRVLAVNDVELVSWDEWVTLIRANPMITMTLKIQRGDDVLTLNVTPDAIMDDKAGRIGRIGARPDGSLVKYPEGMMRELQYGPLDSVTKAVDYAWSRIVLTISAIGKMVVGKISLDNISGPITIAKVAGDSASYGLESFLTFVAYLSISLGVLNLLPIPVLDGGHLMYYLVEMVKGSPVSEKTQAIGNSLGLGLLVMFMGLAFYNDLMGL
ncbi:MAG: RIP metalloprotease RseP [Gammaproteobacteria bacterium]